MNRKHTTLLVMMMVSFLAVGTALAQDTGNTGSDREQAREKGDGMPHRDQRGRMGSERAIGRMTRELDLDEAQAEQVEDIYAAMKPEFDSFREQGRAIRKAMRDLNSEDADYDDKKQALSAEREALAVTGKNLRERIQSEVDAVLTPEQREELAAAYERRRDHGPRNRRRGEGRPEA